jgi:hypothetical protein
VDINMNNLSFDEYITLYVNGGSIEDLPWSSYFRHLMEEEGMSEVLTRAADGDESANQQFLNRIAQRILPTARDDWPLTDILNAAQDHPIGLASPHLERHERRAKQLFDSLRADPSVRAEVKRLQEFHDSKQESAAQNSNYPKDLSPELYADDLVYREAAKYARTHPHGKVSARELECYLMNSVVPITQRNEFLAEMEEKLRQVSIAAHGEYIPSWWTGCIMSRAQAWTNISGRTLDFKMRPGSVLVDVTTATQEDILELWDAIEQTQQRLGKPKPNRGRPNNDDIYKFVARQKEKRPPLQWKKIHENTWHKFGERCPPSPDALREGYRRYRVRVGPP